MARGTNYLFPVRNSGFGCAARWKKSALALCSAAALLVAQGAEERPVSATLDRPFADWKAACDRLPSNRALKGHLPPRSLLPLPAFSEVDSLLEDFFHASKTGELSFATSWVGARPSTNTFFNTRQAYFLTGASNRPAIPFEPFAQKVDLPPNSEVYVRGDLHGDLRSLMANLTWLNENEYLRGFGITRSNFYMIFLGDFTDRGVYGIEVIYTVLRLKRANPGRVFLSRGNHEDISLQARYGFHWEGQGKYGAAFNPARIARAWDFLPVVIYLGSGTNFIQCNHGGMEPGFNPRALLAAEGSSRYQFIGQLSQRQFLAQHADALAESAARQAANEFFQDFHPQTPSTPDVIGFMWNDFTLQPREPQFAPDPDRAYVYGTRATASILRSASSTNRHVHAVFRAHQHSTVTNPMMRRLVASRGLFRHWQAAEESTPLNAPMSKLTAALEREPSRSIPPGSVWTFNVGADSFYGEGSDYSFDTFGILKLAPEFKDWRVQIVNVPLKL